MEPAQKIGPILKLLDQHYSQVHVTLRVLQSLGSCWWLPFFRPMHRRRATRFPAVFAKYPTAADMPRPPWRIRSTPSTRTASTTTRPKSLKGLGQALAEQHGGQVPASLADFWRSSRVSAADRPTSSWATPSHPGGIVVDTHCGRVSQRLGLTTRRRNPGEDQVDLGGRRPGAAGALDQVFPATHLAWPGPCHRQKSPMSRCPLLPYCDYGQNVMSSKR